MISDSKTCARCSASLLTWSCCPWSRSSALPVGASSEEAKLEAQTQPCLPCAIAHLISSPYAFLHFCCSLLSPCICYPLNSTKNHPEIPGIICTVLKGGQRRISWDKRLGQSHSREPIDQSEEKREAKLEAGQGTPGDGQCCSAFLWALLCGTACRQGTILLELVLQKFPLPAPQASMVKTFPPSHHHQPRVLLRFPRAGHCSQEARTAAVSWLMQLLLA